MEATGKGDHKKDSAWKYAKEVPTEKYFRCKFCDHVISGTIYRLKNHLAATRKGVKSCPKVPEDVKIECNNALAAVHGTKSKRNELLQELRANPNKSYECPIPPTLGNKESSSQPNQVPKPLVLIDMFTTPQAQQASLDSEWENEERKEVCQKIGRFFFSSGLSFNAINDPYFGPMCVAISRFGPGFSPPSMHELRTWILKEEVKNINSMLVDHKKAWRTYGCSIILNGWTDGKGKVRISFLVNSPIGTWFLRSIDASDTSKIDELLFNSLDAIVDEIGEENVVQVITNNEVNYMNARNMLMEKREKLYWLPCAAYLIDLILEDIGKLKLYHMTLDLARQVVKFIYGHAWVLKRMRTFTNNQELLRPAATRFAISYLTLQSIYNQRQPLQSMFSSEEWNSSSWSKNVEGIKATSTILDDPKFWGNVALCVKTTVPLINVLRKLDSEEKPAMGYVYGLMTSAKKEIASNCCENKKEYVLIWNKIDKRWADLLHHPLHAAGYYLNPQLRYEESFEANEQVKKGLLACMDRMLERDDRLKADVQLDFFDNKLGDFGSRLAMDSRNMRSPANWWMRFGDNTPELRKFAVRVLSLTCSASDCERDWCNLDTVHSKKRNKLEHERLNALVYVMYNSRLRERSIKRRQKCDSILVEQIDSDDEWIAEKEDLVLPTNLSWLDNEDLFDVDAVRLIPCTSSSPTNVDILTSTSCKTKRHASEITPCEDKSKGKRKRMTQFVLDLEEKGTIGVDVLDEGNDIDENDLE